MNMDIPIVYVSHPFIGVPANLDKAMAWCAFLSANFDALFVAPWVPLCKYWPNCGESLKRGMDLDYVAVRAADGLIAVGGEMSPGMRREWNVAIDGQGSKISRVVDISRFASPDELEADADAMDWLGEMYGRTRR